MSIIYSYPEQGALNADDLLIGTSAAKVGGKQKNITRNFSIQQIADFINRGAGLVDPVATDFQIAVFNQAGKKITGSIMSQDAFPGGTGITITGNLTTTGNISTSGNLTAPGNVILGGGGSSVSLLGTITLGGPIIDSSGTTGSVNQILLSSGTGEVNWQNYEAGLTYEGTWDAANNTTNGLSNSPALVSGTGVSGHFYIVNVAGNTTLDTNSDWHVGDWAVFLDQGGQPAAWQKIDNTSTLVGSGTAGTLSKWTNATTLNDSLVSEAGTVVSVNGDLKVKDTIQATTANTNLKLKGVGTGGIEIMSADGVTDGKITLNCSQNSHGVTLQSPAHASGATYTLVLPTSTGTAGQILTTAGGSSSQLTWTTPLGNVIQAVSGPLTSGNIPIANGAYSVTDSIMSYAGTVISVNGDFSTQGLEVNKYLTDGTGSNGTDGQVLTSTTSGGDKEILWVDSSTIGDTYDLGSGASGVSNSIELQLTSGSGTDNSAITLTGGTGITVAQVGDVVTLTGSAQGVTSVTGDSATIAATSGNTPVISAITTGGVSSGSTSLATGAQIQTAIDSALAGAVTFKGTFNANTGSITGTSDFLYNPGANTNTVPIAIGDMYIVTVAGNFYGNTALNVGDEVIAIAAAAINSSSEAGWNAVASGAGGAITGSGTTNYVPKFTGATVVGNSSIFNDASGNVGIGTANPGAKLHTLATGGTTPPALGSSPDTAMLGGGLFGTLFSTLSSGKGVIQQGRTDGTATAYDLLLQPSGGNVGIGTSSPGAKLQVTNGTAGRTTYSNDGNDVVIDSTGSGTGMTIASDRASYGVIYFADQDSGTRGIFRYDHVDNSMRLGTDGSERMRIDSSGNVGIGTDQPQVSLDLSNNTDAIIVPNGPTADRPSGILPGMIRYNTSTSEFEGYSGTLNVSGSWGALGGGSLPTKTVDTFTGSGQSFIDLTVEASSVNYIDMYIDGVYQAKATYTIATPGGTGISRLTLVSGTFPTGVSIETVTTT